MEAPDDTHHLDLDQRFEKSPFTVLRSVPDLTFLAVLL